MKKALLILLIISSFAINDLPSYYIHRDQTPLVNYLMHLNTSNTPSGIKPIDCIYMINLDIRKDRWIRASKLFNKLHIHVNRVRGFNGWDLSQEDMQYMAGPYPINISGGLYGCLISHISILKDAYEKGYSTIWIMEDDIKIVGNVHKIPDLISELDTIDQYWDILYTDLYKGCKLADLNLFNRPDQDILPESYYKYEPHALGSVVPVRHRRQMHSYIVSRRGIKKILNYFSHVYVWTSFGRDVHYIPEIYQYSVKKDIIIQWTKAGSDTKPDTDLNLYKNKLSQIYCRKK